MDKSPNKSMHIKKAAAAVLIAVVAAFFITDTVRTKWFGLPPVFCIQAVTYDDGISASYYGAGYKIKRDYDITDGSEEYYITLWVLPDSLSL